MRTFINCVTKITGIGFGQVRVIVKVRDDRRARAAQHLALWQDHGHLSGILAAYPTLARAAAALAKAFSSTPKTLCLMPVGSPSGMPMRSRRSADS